MRPSSKVFNDPIHGHIELSGLSVKIIDTPQFQRLREVSQLGGCYYVFPGAASRRFEHSLGVSHLAKQFVNALRVKQPELGITDEDVLCIEVAGLCHDLGHGPFSHLYDGKFLPTINHNHDFAHEHASIGLFDHLIHVNKLEETFSIFGLNSDDIQFIKELMLGDKTEGPPGFEWKGRGNKTFLYDIVANKRNGIDVDKFDYFARDCHVLGVTKSFDSSRLMRFAMAFRVSRGSDHGGYKGRSFLNDDIELSGEMNGGAQHHNNGLNDSSHLKSSNNSSQSSSVAGPGTAGSASSDGCSGQYPLEICFHVKEAWNIFELFHTRYALHKRAYQHRVSAAVELMLLEVLLLAEPHLLFPGTEGTLRRMSECPRDMEAYWKLSDSIVKQIETSYSPELAPARAMIYRLRTRDLFAFSGEIILSGERRAQLHLGGAQGSGVVKKQLVQLLKQQQRYATENKLSPNVAAEKSVEVAEEDIFCEIVKVSYGKGAKNPVSGPTAFYEPKKPLSPSPAANMLAATGAAGTQEEEWAVDMREQNKCWSVGVVPQDAVSRVTPREFEETYIRVFCRYKAQSSTVRDIFQQWCQSNRVTQPITPMKRSRCED